MTDVGAVENVSMTIRAGEAVALVGESTEKSGLSLMRLFALPVKSLADASYFAPRYLTLTEREMQTFAGAS
jgi:ABC-type microcin C transport system duplicated ATPase subunit YejF